MARVPFSQAKEVTTSDISGQRITIPPGRIYRGKRMSKGEFLRMRREDWGEEVNAPRLADIERQLEDIFDVGEGT